jgi:hypothetical protein
LGCAVRMCPETLLLVKVIQVRLCPGPFKAFLQGIENTKRQKWYVRLWNNKPQFVILALLICYTAQIGS